MTPRKRRLWENCCIMFYKYDIHFDSEEEREDVIKELSDEFLENKGSIEELIIEKYYSKIEYGNEQITTPIEENIVKIEESINIEEAPKKKGRKGNK